MSIPECNSWPLETAIAALTSRVDARASFHKEAGKFCLALTSLANHSALYNDVLAQYGIVKKDTDFNGGLVRQYCFWIEDALPLPLSGSTLIPRSISIDIEDGNSFTASFHTDPGDPSGRIQIEPFTDTPRWWLDEGSALTDADEEFFLEDESAMCDHLITSAKDVEEFREVGQAVLLSVSRATWIETLNINGHLI